MNTDNEIVDDLRGNAWRQWLERCQCSLCDDAEKNWLENTIFKRTRELLNRIQGGCDFWDNEIDGEDRSAAAASTARLFENWLKLKKAEISKLPAKSYLANRSEGRINHLEALVTGCLRDHLRMRVREEGAQFIKRHPFESLQKTVSQSEGGENETKLESLLQTLEPKPDQEAELNDLKSIASECAGLIYLKMTHDEQLILYALATEKPLSDPQIVSKATVNRSSFYAKKEVIATKIAQYIQNEYSRDIEEDIQLEKFLYKEIATELIQLAGDIFGKP